MSSILTCPACQQSVSLPAGRVALLECPHCHSGISLQPQVAPLTAHVAGPASRAIVHEPTRGKPAHPHVNTTTEYHSRQPQRSTGPSALGQFVGIVAGGVLGTVLGYWLLNYFGGSRYDFLHIPLPLVAHTQPTESSSDAATQPAATPAASATLTSAATATPPALAPAAEPLAAVPKRMMPDMAPPADPPRRAIPFPRYSSSDLGESLSAAHAAVGCPHCKSTGFVREIEVTGVSQIGDRQIQRKAPRRVPCEHCGGKPTGRITADVFARLCQLSQVLTFVEMDPGDPQRLHRKKAVEQVLLSAASDQQKQNALGRLAGYHLAETSRATSGVLLAGTVQSIDRQGRLFTTRLVLFGLPEVVTVVSMTRPPLKPTDKALIAGSIIDAPRDKLVEYEGTLPQVVWGGLPVKLLDDRP
jgi:hypothetical protein